LDGCKVFLEPEECCWAEAANQKSGFFTALTWFRSQRVPKLYEAEKLRLAGQRVYVDSVYDSLCSYWLGKKGMDWLIPPSDVYFSVAMDLACLDKTRLPKPDVLIIFEIEEHDWKNLLHKRGRALDGAQSFSGTHYTQQYYVDAGLEYAKEFSVKVVRFKQRISTTLEAATNLKRQLECEGVL
jgi:hypothetical protein